MNETELKQARKQYRTAIKDNKELDEIKQEIEKLKQSKEVLRYIELSKYENVQIKSDEEMVKSSFRPIGFSTKDSNNIYVFMGSYKKNFGVAADSLSPIKNAPWTDYNVYWDLETEIAIKVIKEKINSFEKNHVVIDNKMPVLSSNFRDYYDNFIKIQAKYYKNLTYTTIEKSISRIRKTFK